jgi:hypothetical protein
MSYSCGTYDYYVTTWKEDIAEVKVGGGCLGCGTLSERPAMIRKEVLCFQLGPRYLFSYCKFMHTVSGDRLVDGPNGYWTPRKQV